MICLDELLHMDIQEAQERLQQEGCPYRTVHTNPPKRPIEGEERVCRVLRDGETVVLTTATYIREK